MKYVALLRGINPMNAPNAKLVALFEGLGFTGVQTVVSSGNVVFTASSKQTAILEKTIEKALTSLVGEHSLAIVRQAEQIEKLAGSAPFGNRSPTPATYLAVTFFKRAPNAIQHQPPFVAYEPDCLALCTVNDNTTRPPFMAQLERTYGKEITTRTWSVVLKIARKMAA